MKMKGAKKLILYFMIVFIAAFGVADALPLHAQVQPIIEVEEKIQGISDVEMKVMEDLFTISQKIEELGRREEQTQQGIEILQTETVRLEDAIDKKQISYNKQLDVLERILVGYQRNGPASFLETILKSKTLTEFIQSLNMIRELSRNSGHLLDALEISRKELALERENLIEHGKRLEETMDQLQQALAEMHQLKEEQETILNSLADAKDLYQNELNSLQLMWDEIKVLFSEILVHFTSIIERGEFPVEALNLRIGFFVVSGTIYAQTLNDILKDQPEIPQMLFHFSPDEIRVEVPEKQLVLIGEFSIMEKRILQFEVNRGSFYGMPLTESSINELFRNGPIVIDFKELMGDVVVESVEFFDGYLDFVMAPDFS